MDSNTQGFWSDPKVLFALLALLISIISLIWTLANQHEQNRRWDAMNAGTIELGTCKFTTTRVLTAAEYKNYVSDYFVRAYGLPSAPGSVQFIHNIRLRDKKTNDVVADIDPTYNLAGIDPELKKMGYKDSVIALKHYEFQFQFKNTGKTEVKNLVISVQRQTPDGIWEAGIQPQTPTRVPAGEDQLYVRGEIEQKPLDRLPAKLHFRISWTFDDVSGNHQSRTVAMTWNDENNGWAYE